MPIYALADADLEVEDEDAFWVAPTAVLIGRVVLKRNASVWWGAVLPLTAAFLGTALALQAGRMHPLTRWHLFVDLVVGPICIYLLRRPDVEAQR